MTENDRVRMEQAEWMLDRVRQFLDAVPGEAGLTSRDVDRLCAIAHGRGDLEPKPIDTKERP